MSENKPISLSSSDSEDNNETSSQPAKRLKRSADDLAISSLVAQRAESSTTISVPRSSERESSNLPFEVYILTTEDYHYNQGASVQGIYVTFADAQNAAWREMADIDPNPKVRLGEAEGFLVLSSADGGDGGYKVAVRRTKLWAPGSVPPYNRTGTATNAVRAIGEEDDEEDDGDEDDFDNDDY